MSKKYLSKYYKQFQKLYDEGTHPCGYMREVGYHKDRGFGGLCVLLSGGACRVPHSDFTSFDDLGCEVYKNYFEGKNE